MLFSRSRLWIIESTVLSCLHTVWLTNGVTHDQSARGPNFTRATRLIRHRPGCASLVHSFTDLLCRFHLHHHGATAPNGPTLHFTSHCIPYRLVSVDTATGSHGCHRPQTAQSDTVGLTGPADALVADRLRPTPLAVCSAACCSVTAAPIAARRPSF
jgi:hypothetical protein